ncbi:Uncharacterized protein MJ0963, partial [Durusdinium trenchii]
MAFAMADVVSACDWQADTLMVLNDPYLGGTHLPDVTVIAPVFAGDGSGPCAFAVTRAHHANIGADTPGSMPVSTSLEQEGVVIAPTWLCRGRQWNLALASQLTGETGLKQAPLHAPRFADFAAQASAARVGARRLATLLEEMTPAVMQQALDALNAYGERLARQSISAIPDGCYRFEDVMDDDGQGHQDLPICVQVTVSGSDVTVDFAGTSDQVPGNINAPLSVAAAAVYYVFRCLMPADAPACAGLFRPIALTAPEGSLVNARRPAALAAGNVETSMRLVDAVLGALAAAVPQRIPAASHGSMNNLAMGARGEQGWDYYETAGGGLGAHAGGDGRKLMLSYPPRLLAVLVSLAAGSASTVAMAADDGAADVEASTLINLDTVQIVGDSSDTFTASGSAWVLDSKDLEENEYTDIHRIVREVPGVYFQEEDGYGLRPNIGIRGSGSGRSSKITLMEDGILMAPAPYSAPSAYYFPVTGRMSGLEVLKGPDLLRYGPYTVGGAVNLLSTPVPSYNGGMVNVEMGENGEVRNHVWMGGSKGQWGALLEAHQHETDGYKNIDYSDADTGFDKSDYVLKLRWRAPSDAALQQQVELKLQRDTEVSNETYLGLTDADFRADPNRRYSASEFDRMETEHESVVLRHKLFFNDTTSLTTALYRNDFY